MFWQVSSRVQDLSWSFPGSYHRVLFRNFCQIKIQKSIIFKIKIARASPKHVFEKRCTIILNFCITNSIMYTQETPPEMPQNEQMEWVLTTVGTQTCLTKIILNWSVILRSANDQQLDFGIWILQRYKSNYKIMKSGWIWHTILIIFLRIRRRMRSCHF